MAVPFENRNFQKELDKKIKPRHFFYTAVVHRAAVM